MTAIVGIQTENFALIVADKLGVIGTKKEHNFDKAYYGKNYVIAFAGTMPFTFINFIESEAENIANTNETSKDIIQYIKTYISTNFPPKTGNNLMCICVKNGIMHYAKYGLSLDNIISVPALNTFVGIGSGGDNLCVGIQSQLQVSGTKIDDYSPEEIRVICEAAIKATSDFADGVGTVIDIFLQKKESDVFYDIGTQEYNTIKFNGNEQVGKKISAIVASSAFCTDGYSLSTSLLEKIATKINTNKASMRYIPISNQYHNQNGEDKIIGEWVEASTHQFQNFTLQKANGYYSENAEIDNNLSASITLNIKEVSLKKNDDGAYIKSVIDADLYDISITANPLDKCCNILQASGEKIIEESDDIMINTFSIEIKNSNFINLLNNDMNTQVELNSKMEELTTNILSEQSPSVLPQHNDESILVENNSKTEDDTKIIDNQLQKDDILNTENNVLKEQIKQYDETLSQTLNLLEQKAQENAKLTESNQILETALKNFIK